MIATTARELGGGDLVRVVGGAAWQLKYEWAKVEVASWSTGWVQGRSSGEAKSKGEKRLFRLVREHGDGRKVSTRSRKRMADGDVRRRTLEREP